MTILIQRHLSECRNENVFCVRNTNFIIIPLKVKNFSYIMYDKDDTLFELGT
jgi:hypothetical protein